MVGLHSLVKRAKKGDGEAFVLLVKQYENVLYRTASRLLRNEEDVADAMQETIATAFERLHTLKKSAYFNTWICKILINKCHHILNQRKNVALFQERFVPEKQDDPFQEIELEEALNSLHVKSKEVLTLYYIVGLNTREIGELLEEPEGTIKSRISRAKSVLKEKYYKYEGVATYE